MPIRKLAAATTDTIQKSLKVIRAGQCVIITQNTSTILVRQIRDQIPVKKARVSSSPIRLLRSSTQN
ncbi:MAG: hypothetical protein U0996_20910 [Planctomycetaceae bacterium]